MHALYRGDPAISSQHYAKLSNVIHYIIYQLLFQREQIASTNANNIVQLMNVSSILTCINPR
jgi:hypothetical protein